MLLAGLRMQAIESEPTSHRLNMNRNRCERVSCCVLSSAAAVPASFAADGGRDRAEHTLTASNGVRHTPVRDATCDVTSDANALGIDMSLRRFVEGFGWPT